MNVGVALCAFVLVIYQRLQSQFDPQESGPSLGNGGWPGVPYHAMPTRPSSPAAIQAKTLVCNVPTGDPEVLIVAGADQVLPWSVEKLNCKTVSPVTCPLPLIGATSQTA